MKGKRIINIWLILCVLLIAVCFACIGCDKNNDKFEHSLTYVLPKDATCTQDGNKEYYKCVGHCDKLFEDPEATKEITLSDVTLPKLGHSPKEYPEKPVSCTEDGHSAYFGCERCDAVFTDITGTELSDVNPFIKATEHKGTMSELVSAKEPNLTDKGNVAYYYCSSCGKCFEDPDGVYEIEDPFIPAIANVGKVTITVDGYKEGEKTDITETVAATAKFNQQATATPNNGVVSFDNVYAMKYVLTSGDYRGEVEFVQGQTEYAVTLQYNYAEATVQTANKCEVDLSKANDVNHTVRLSSEWKDTSTKYYNEVKLNLPDDIKNAKDSIVELTVLSNRSKVDNLNRFAIKMTENEGIFIIPHSGGIHVCVCYRDESDNMFNGWDRGNTKYSNSLRSALVDSGLKLKVLRAETYIRMFAYLDGEWVELINDKGVATCENNADTDIRFAVMDGDYSFANIKYAKPQRVEGVNPTVSATGKREHLIYGDMYFNADGTLTTPQDVILDKLVLINNAVTVNVKGHKDGSKETQIADGKIVLENKRNAQRIEADISNGVISLTSGTVCALEYTLTAQDYAGKVTFSNDINTYNVLLEYKYAETTAQTARNSVADLSKVNDANHEIRLTADWDDLVTTYNEIKLNLPSEIQNAKYATVSVKIKSNIADVDNVHRLGLKMTAQNGVFIFPFGGNIHVCHTNNMFDGYDTSASSVHTQVLLAALAGDGLEVRMVRANTNIRMFVKLNGAWVELLGSSGVATCAEDAPTDIRFAILSGDYTFSDIEYSVMTHVPAKAATKTEEGCIEHYKIGELYFNLNGTLTTQEAVTLPVLEALNVNITLNGYKDGAETFITGEVSFVNTDNNKNFNVMFTNGTATIDDIDAMGYIVTFGDYSGTVEIVTTQTSYNVLLQYKYAEITTQTAYNSIADLSHANDMNHTIKLSAEWSHDPTTAKYNEVKLNLSTDIQNEKYVTVSFKIKNNLPNIDQVYRFDVMMTEGKGIFLSPFDQGILVCQCFTKQGDMFDGFVQTNSGHTQAVLSALNGDGLDVRMVRAGTNIRMFVKLNGSWIEFTVGSNVVTCEENALTDIRLAIMSGDYTFSNIEYSVMTHVPEKAATKTEMGLKEHYTVGGMYFMPDGTLTTQEDVTLPMLEALNVNITLNGYKDGAQTPITGEVSFVNIDNNKNFTVTFTNGTATIDDIDAMTYTITYGDYTGTVDVMKTQTEYTVVLQYKYAEPTVQTAPNSVVDFDHANDANHTINMTAQFAATAQYNEVKLNLPDDIKNAKYATVSVKVKSNVALDQVNRFALKMTENNGVFMFLPFLDKMWVCVCYHDKAGDMFDGWDNNASAEYLNAVQTALQGEGLEMRMVRAGTNIRLFIKLNDAWIELLGSQGVATCDANAPTDIRFAIASGNFTFSNIEFSALEHVEAQEATSEKDGCKEHYKIGETYFNPDGTLTTQDAITLKYGAFAESTVQTAPQSTVDLSNNTIHLTAAWTGESATSKYNEVKLNLPDEVKNSKYAIVSVKVKSNGTPLDVHRFAVKMTADNGVHIFPFNSNSVIFVCHTNPSNMFDGYDSNASGMYANAILTALAGDGLDVRMVRAGTNIRMFVKINGAWIELLGSSGVATCAEDAPTDIRFAILSGNYTFSNIEYSVLEHVAANSETGTAEHYKIEDMFFNPDGTLTTQEAVMPNKQTV